MSISHGRDSQTPPNQNPTVHTPATPLAENQPDSVEPTRPHLSNPSAGAINTTPFTNTSLHVSADDMV